MATFISNFDSQDVETIQAAESTIRNREKAEEAFDNMFRESNKALNKLFAELWR